MSTDQSTPAVLMTEHGDRFEGLAYGALGQALGTAHIFAQATGYQEVLTHPDRRGDIIVFSSPHIGIVGVNDADAGAETMQAAGVVVRDPSRMTSNFRATRDLASDLERDRVVGIGGIDTRALVRRIREAEGPLRIGIFSGPSAQLERDEQLAAVQHGEGTI